MALDYLKKLFAEGAITFEQFETAYNAQAEAADGVKLVNLTEGGYVAMKKFKDKEAELETATSTIAGLQDTVKKFDGVDVEKLKGEVTDAKKKFDADLAQARKDSAIQVALVEARARNTKAARALLDETKITLNADGTLSGLDVEALRKSDPYLFEIEEKLDEGGGHEGGKPGDITVPNTLEGAVKAALENSTR